MLSICQVLDTLQNLKDTEAFKKGGPSPLVAPGPAEETEAGRVTVWCNHAEVEMSAQSFVATHQGLVLSASAGWGLQKGVAISTGLCRLSGVFLADKQGEEPGLPAFAEWGAWLDLSMLELSMVSAAPGVSCL